MQRDKKILITGVAGFIGYHMAKNLCIDGYEVFGVDSINDYYDTTLKENRLLQLDHFANFSYSKIDIKNKEDFDVFFNDKKPDVVVHLAAQVGVSDSLKKPYQYIDNNIYGFMNVLEACRASNIQHLLFASSSSVYGAGTTVPYAVDCNTDLPISLYAATKKANEVLAYSYAHLYKIPITGLRFFTVYGPWGRPDMAYMAFTDSIINDKPVKLFNHGKMMRDFTYVDDIVTSIKLLISKPPQLSGEEQSGDDVSYRMYNIGNSKPVGLQEFISILEDLLGKKAIIENREAEPGHMLETYADVEPLIKIINYRPKTDLKEGLADFINWYKAYYKVD